MLKVSFVCVCYEWPCPLLVGLGIAARTIRASRADGTMYSTGMSQQSRTTSLWSIGCGISVALAAQHDFSIEFS